MVTLYDRGVANNAVVTVNAGSSSMKVDVFAVGSNKAEMSHVLAISINNIGRPNSLLQISSREMVVKSEEVYAPDHTVACDSIMQKVMQVIPVDTVAAIGHRLVHGGGKFTRPTALKDISEEDWQFLSQIDPLHTPVAREIAARFIKNFPSALQVGCFDTAFFEDLPDVAKLVPIPKKYYSQGVRRYGFHGLSYTSLLETFCEKAGEVAVNGRVILAHLGSGASITAMRYGKPVDTTMGFTPVSGIPMSTRSGDLDPSVFHFLHHQNNMTINEFDDMVNLESGLFGVSGVSGDMRELLTLENTNKDAALAVELFVMSVKKSIGAYASILGGVDSLIFAGGIGEQSAVLRARICEGLEYAGIEINEAANEQHSFLISAEHSRAGVHVISANEALVIAKEVAKLIKEERD